MMGGGYMGKNGYESQASFSSIKFNGVEDDWEMLSFYNNITIVLVPELFLYLSNRSLHYIKKPSNKSLNCLIRYQIDPWNICVQNKVKRQSTQIETEIFHSHKS